MYTLTLTSRSRKLFLRRSSRTTLQYVRRSITCLARTQTVLQTILEQNADTQLSKLRSYSQQLRNLRRLLLLLALIVNIQTFSSLLIIACLLLAKKTSIFRIIIIVQKTLQSVLLTRLIQNQTFNTTSITLLTLLLYLLLSLCLRLSISVLVV